MDHQQPGASCALGEGVAEVKSEYFFIRPAKK
jgi:hypothetical protein